ncbi:integrase core domain protein [Lasius niger]|uniref:Integrase core domain protein n=1 Tax=Lasius niger TaxID=67767 RepID=A0A0J7KE60_LASNI|nr:integrase core domain protein [Lasius niger]
MQFDVKTAFLNGELKENVYMLPPEGIVVKSDMVCKLNKALYGLKQASCCWTQRFDGFLKNIGFIQSDADKCVYQGIFNKSKILLALYVDDGLIMGNDKKILQNIISQLEANFEITENYIRRIIKKFNIDDAKTVSTPADTHVHLSSDSNNKTKIKVPYREAVGSLMFVAIVTRPDIAFAVGGRYLDRHDATHWGAVKRILRYLKETEHYGITFTKTERSNIVKGYSDSDFASDTDTRRSTTGYIFKLINGPVTWSSQRQSVVSLSTTEAEYIAASCAAREAAWIRQLLQDIEESIAGLISLFIDNQSAIKLIRNAEFHKRTKHVDIRYHYIREKLTCGDIDVHYVRERGRRGEDEDKVEGAREEKEEKGKKRKGVVRGDEEEGGEDEDGGGAREKKVGAAACGKREGIRAENIAEKREEKGNNKGGGERRAGKMTEGVGKGIMAEGRREVKSARRAISKGRKGDRRGEEEGARREEKRKERQEVREKEEEGGKRGEGVKGYGERSGGGNMRGKTE